MNLYNNPRIFEYCGHTPNDMMAMNGGPKMSEGIAFGPNVMKMFADDPNQIDQFIANLNNMDIPDALKKNMIEQALKARN